MMNDSIKSLWLLCNKIFFKHTFFFRTIYLLAVFLSCFLSVCAGFKNVFAEIRNDSVEIIAGGRKYTSLEHYLLSKQSYIVKSAESGPFMRISFQIFITPLYCFMPNVYRFNSKDTYFEWSVLRLGTGKDNKQLGKFKLNANGVFGWNEQFLPALLAMSKVGFNTGVIQMIKAFQNPKHTAMIYKNINSRELENVLSESFPDDGYSGPILLISDKNKLRIMTLDSKQKHAIDHQE